MATVKVRNEAESSNRFFQAVTANSRQFSATSLARLQAANALAEERHRAECQAIRRGADAPGDDDNRLAMLKVELDRLGEQFHSRMQAASGTDARGRVEAEMNTAIMRARSDWRNRVGQL